MPLMSLVHPGQAPYCDESVFCGFYHVPWPAKVVGDLMQGLRHQHHKMSY